MPQKRYNSSILLSLLFLALLTWPVLSVFNNKNFVLGMPRLYLYLLVAVGILVLLLFVITRIKNQHEE
jgi:hypothetical protein